MYAILRARRASSTEAVILCAPYRESHDNTLAGIALMFCLANAFKRKCIFRRRKLFLEFVVYYYKQLQAGPVSPPFLFTFAAAAFSHILCLRFGISRFEMKRRMLLIEKKNIYWILKM